MTNSDLDDNLSNEYRKKEINKNPKNSVVWAWLNLTNLAVNNTRFYHNSTVPIEGRLFDPIPPQNGFPGYKVALIVDGITYPQFNNITDINGVFKIYNYSVNASMNIYTSHKIEAQVIDPTPDQVDLKNYFIIYANATSYFDVDNHNQNIPQLAGGYYDIPGFLNYDNHSGIPDQTINSMWKNETIETFIPPNSPFNTKSDGSFKYIPIPDDNVSKIFYLNLTYAGNNTYINGSQKMIPINIYRNITCVWSTVGSATQGKTIYISGQIFARNDSNLAINDTDFRLMFQGGASIGNITTETDGSFSYPYRIPSEISGLNVIAVELDNFSYVYSNTTHLISISSAPITPAGDIGDDDEDTAPPFQNFFIIFIPIIIGVVVALGIFVVFFLKRQKEESLIVKLPLEDRIINFKILKDTGRLEEALSYLFQSIYMELINAKYGVVKKENETIRDFAIISVKELKLNPNSIYPFIQNIERIIYDRPFIIKERDFYNSVELFSPIYFELTGFYFTLNF